MDGWAPLTLTSSPEARRARYVEVLERLRSILADEADWVSAMATVACELHHAFAYHDWTGFYRVVGPTTLRVGPYQGGHGCLQIDFARGVCGAAARTQETQVVADVDAFPGHIACSSETRSEIVAPILASSGRLLAVLDIDSNAPAAFSDGDREGLEAVCRWLGERYGEATRL